MRLHRKQSNGNRIARGVMRSRQTQSTQKGRRLGFQQLENRNMLAADLDIVGFDANGSDLVVRYDIANANVSAFDIAIYSSVDGVNTQTLLDTFRVTQSGQLTQGTGHSQAIEVDFTDLASDYYLIAVLDSGSEISESNESNNETLFEGGVFQTTSGVVHVHGDNTVDTVNISQGTSISVTLNNSTETFTTASVTEIHVRLHDGNDTLTTGTGVQVEIDGYGGDGNDNLEGGDGDDTLYGGAGDDIIYGGDGDDWIDGEAGEDSLYGQLGNDELEGGAGIDSLDGGTGVDIFAYGGPVDDVVADKPDITSVVQSTEGDGYWLFTGQVVDDGNLAGRTITFGGEAWGSTTLAADGTFTHFVLLEEGVEGVVTVNFTDEEGLAADQFTLWISDPF